MPLGSKPSAIETNGRRGRSPDERTGRHPPVLGIDLGGTKTLVAVVSDTNEILGRAKRATPAERVKRRFSDHCGRRR